MANTPQARKRARQADSRRDHNAAFRSRARTQVKRVVKAIKDQDKEAARKAYREAASVLDSTARKGIIHPNKAARQKHRLNAQIKNLSA